ncbi:MAG: pyrroline-5-carboxylate reductase [Acidimicrobiales bacterium]
MRIVVVGGGKMGEALVSGVLRAKWARPSQVAVVEPVAARRATLEGLFPGVKVGETVPKGADGVILAVKPTDVASACEAVVAARPARVLSIAAGVTLATLEQHLGDLPVVRAMPNTPALIGVGAAAIAPGAKAAPADLAWAEAVLGSVGIVIRVTEASLDAVTGLSGSGPAYIFLVAEALVDAGVLAGLDRGTSAALTRQTILGAARMLAESEQLPEALRAAVTSPGGTTAAGLRVLEARAVRAAFLDAVAAATQRSRELGGVRWP